MITAIFSVALNSCESSVLQDAFRWSQRGLLATDLFHNPYPQTHTFTCFGVNGKELSTHYKPVIYVNK